MLVFGQRNGRDSKNVVPSSGVILNARYRIHSLTQCRHTFSARFRETIEKNTVMDNHITCEKISKLKREKGESAAKFIQCFFNNLDRSF